MQHGVNSGELLLRCARLRRFLSYRQCFYGLSPFQSLYSKVLQLLRWHSQQSLEVSVCGFSVLVESISDRQLAAFLSKPENTGKLMTKGLWAVSRHPNYFGEALLWWGLWIMTLATPYWIVALVSPLAITFLLRYVSGVPMTESYLSKKEGWEAYAASTPVFIPKIM